MASKHRQKFSSPLKSHGHDHGHDPTAAFRPHGNFVAEDVGRVHQAIFDQIPDAILILDPRGAGRILLANTSAARLLGWTEEELIGRDRSVILDPRDAAVVRLLEDRARTGLARAELIYKRKNGTTFPAEVSSSLFTDAAGQDRAITIIRDLSERKGMEAALREKERIYRLLFGAMPGGFALSEVVPDGEGRPHDFRFLEVNPAFTEITGLTAAAAIGRTLRELRPDIDSGFIESLIRVARSGRTRVFEARDAALDRWFEVYAFRPEEGRVGYILVDITDRKESQAELVDLKDELERRVEERTSSLRRVSAMLEAVMDNIPIVICVYDDRGRLRMVNREFERLLGWSPDELSGRDIMPVFYPDPGYRDRVWDHMTKARAGEWQEFEVTARGGEKIPMSWANVPLPEAYIGIGLDLRRQKEAEETLRRQAEAVRQTQKMEALGTLAGGIAHDLNNMLMPISMNAELALLEIPEGGPAPAYLRTILQAVSRARDLVRQILTFSAIRPQERRPIRLDSAVRESLKLLRSSLPATIEIRPRFEGRDGIIRADPTEIHQVIMNLGANAGRAMRERGGLLEVEVEPAELDAESAARHPDLRPGSYLRLTFRDTGEGMPPEVLARVFDPFYTTKPPGEGTGMGLAVVHGIVKSLNGAVLGSSVIGRGTTFEIYLPREPGAVVPAPSSSAGPIPGGTERVLFIEDEETQAETVRDALERLGYRVVVARDGAAAVDAFRADPQGFDVVVTDQTMPFWTGTELAREMLAARPGLPIVLCTGYSDRVNADTALTLGIRGFLMKPYTIRELAESIRAALSGG